MIQSGSIHKELRNPNYPQGVNANGIYYNFFLYIRRPTFPFLISFQNQNFSFVLFILWLLIRTHDENDADKLYVSSSKHLNSSLSTATNVKHSFPNLASTMLMSVHSA